MERIEISRLGKIVFECAPDLSILDVELKRRGYHPGTIEGIKTCWDRGCIDLIGEPLAVVVSVETPDLQTKSYAIVQLKGDILKDGLLRTCQRRASAGKRREYGTPLKDY